MMILTRRQVLFGLAGVGFLGGCRGNASKNRAAAESIKNGAVSPVLVFSPEVKPIIDAVIDTILPGARAAGVPDYMAYWLAKGPFEATRRFLLHGLKTVDGRAQQQFKKPFVKCNTQQQASVLRPFAEGKRNSRRFNGALFYQQVTELTLEGFLSDPKYGGNRDRVGWKFIGIPDGLRSCWWNPNGVKEVLGHD